jgi:hypothetical protein
LKWAEVQMYPNRNSGLTFNPGLALILLWTDQPLKRCIGITGSIPARRSIVAFFRNSSPLSLYNVGNGLYRVFTTAKRALSFYSKKYFFLSL